MQQCENVVLGGGISGLLTAYNLRKRGMPCCLLEKSGESGGVIQTLESRGYTFDRAANSLSAGEGVEALISELGLEDKVQRASPEANKRYILRENELYPLEPHPFKLLKTKLVGMKAKWRLLTEAFVPRGKGDEESVAGFFRRRLGKEWVEYAVKPVVGGIYAGDAERLSVQSVFPAIVAMEQDYGSLVKGLKASRPKKGRGIISFRGGMKTLVGALEKEIAGNVELSCRVYNVARRDNRWLVKYFSDGGEREVLCDRIFCTLPAYAAAGIFTEIDKGIHPFLGAVPYPPVALIHLGYREKFIKRPLDSFGFLVPPRENKALLGALWNSVIFNDRAPEGKAAFTLFAGGRLFEDVMKDKSSREKLFHTARTQFEEIMGIGNAPDFMEVTYWPKAIPQMELGYGTIVQFLNNIEKLNPGLHFGGNYRWGPSLNDCIRGAQNVVGPESAKT